MASNNRPLGDNPTITELALYVMMNDDVNKAAIQSTNENIEKIFRLFETSRIEKLQADERTTEHRVALSGDIATVKSQVVSMAEYAEKCDKDRDEMKKDVVGVKKSITDIEKTQANQAGRTTVLNALWMGTGGLLVGLGGLFAWIFPSLADFKEWLVNIFTHVAHHQ